MPSPVQNWWDLSNTHEPAYGWWLLTFIIFVGLVIHFVRKPLGIYLEARSYDIKRAIEEAKRAKEEAIGRMAEYDAKVAALDTQIAELKAEMQSRGLKEKADFEKAASQLAQQITKEAEENLVSEVRHALQTLKSDMANAIVSAAKSQIEASKDRATEAGLKNVFNKGVSEVHN